ncbi:MAG: protease modulator HflC [Gammaproteobacteria bacterium]|nr:protease modulator HflC [Gammaproteobacteria bacterium]MBU1646294.1 protease modulator HflC [Gammaproteobacteria bacterium]MBU1970837.1 protease modulator HflC [Gammaproteobacteria bacterium]
MNRYLPFIGSGFMVAMIVAAMTLFTVDQRQYAIVFQLGEVKEVIRDPGLAFKWPMIQNVRFFDRRILTLDTAEPERFLTAEKKPVLVDSYVKWRIHDVKLYYISVAGDETVAKTRLAQTVNSGLREEFGKRTVHDVVSGARDKIMADVQKKADADMRAIGVEVVDVRLKRVDYPTDVAESVYRRMETERKRVANELRSEGAAQAEKIRADADRQREVIVAEAYRDAQKIKGEGDAKAASTYGQAFSLNPEFYSFYRSLEAYRSSFKTKNDVLVVEPNSDFFKYLKNPGKGGAK